MSQARGLLYGLPSAMEAGTMISRAIWFARVRDQEAARRDGLPKSQKFDMDAAPFGTLRLTLKSGNPDSGSNCTGAVAETCGHTQAEPKILASGMDVAWPAGWTEQQASVWRAKNGLAAPGIASAVHFFTEVPGTP